MPNNGDNCLIAHHSAEDGQAPVRVLCVGNRYGADDGLGARVHEVLMRKGLPGGATLKEMGLAGVGLLDEMEGTHAVVVVDVLRLGGRPGTVRRIEGAALPLAARRPLAAHDLGIAEVLAMGRALLGDRMSPLVVLIGAEGAVLDRFGSSLSAPVQHAVGSVARRVIREVVRLSGGAA